MISNTSLHTTYQPVSCLVVYHADAYRLAWEVERSEVPPEYYLEQHAMYEKRGKFYLREGRPVRPEMLGAIAETLTPPQRMQRHFRGRIPRRLLYFSHQPEVLVWQVDSALRSLTFKMHEVPSGQYPCPTLIFRVDGNQSLTVFATKTNRVNERTQLFQAPFPNIGSEGRVCLGSAVNWIEEPDTYEALMQQWENIFFESTFNTDSYHHRAKVELAELWTPLHRTADRFPKKHLLPAQYTLNHLQP